MSAEKNPSDIVPVMIGTAGHVDHGKTSLVKLLTGCDTDRLAEEKKRGLTIDLGFAPCRLPGNRLVGIVDVPGHEDFIRNMVAGASSIDILLLVVAADDGVMPQTREHLQIVNLLRTPKVMAAVTKTDMVDPETVAFAVEEISELLAQSGFPDAPVIPVSNTRLDGIGDVRRTLQELVESVSRSEDRRPFRLNVERVFSVKGYGTVVTGIPTSGRAAPGDELALLPAGSGTTVRAIQSYKQDAEAAVCGACAAINLRDISPDSVSRGMTLVAKGIYSATQSAIISVNNVHDSISLKRNGKARLHAGTGSAAIKTKLLDCEILSPGGEAIIHARLEEPMTLLAGDRVVLRSLNPVTTFAGGTVLSVDDYRLKRSAPGFDERLRTAKKAAAEKAFFRAELLAGGASVFTSADIKKLASGFSDDADSLIKKEEDAGVLFPLGAGWLVLPRAGEITKRITGELSRYHENNPYAWGMEPGLCCELVGLPAESFKGLSHLLAGDNLAVVRHGRLALPGFEPALSAAQIRLRELVVSAAREGGSNPPAEGDLLKSSGAKKDDMRLVVRLLVEDGTICVVGPNLVTAKVVDDCREKMLKLFEENSELELKTFRDATGTSRNFAVALLEKFDREGLTRREGNARLLVKNV